MASKVLFFVGLIVLTILAGITNSIPATAGNVHVFNDGTFLHCDTFTCPQSTEKCIVSGQRSDRDPTMIETWRRCLDRNERVIAEDKKYDRSPNIHEAYGVYVVASKDGTILSSSSSASASSNYGGDIYFPHPRGQNSGSSLQYLFAVYFSLFIYIFNKF